MDGDFHNDTSAVADPVLFDRRLAPHRSLSRSGLLALMAVLIGASSAIGIGFAMMGAWPVIGFCGLDIIVICVVFRLSTLSARRSERIRLTRRELEIQAVDGAGAARRTVMQPYWARVDLVAGGTRTARLLVRSHGRAVELGSFLGAADKAEVAGALAEALRRVRLVPSGDGATA